MKENQFDWCGSVKLDRILADKTFYKDYISKLDYGNHYFINKEHKMLLTIRVDKHYKKQGKFEKKIITNISNFHGTNEVPVKRRVRNE